jgi:hypothetical protein
MTEAHLMASFRIGDPAGEITTEGEDSTIVDRTLTPPVESTWRLVTRTEYFGI